MLTCVVKVKFHYAIWSQTGPKPNFIMLSGRRQVRSWLQTGLKPVIDQQLVLDDRPNFCSLQVCDKIWAGSSYLDRYTERHPFDGLFPRTTSVNQHQKG